MHRPLSLAALRTSMAAATQPCELQAGMHASHSPEASVLLHAHPCAYAEVNPPVWPPVYTLAALTFAPNTNIRTPPPHPPTPRLQAFMDDKAARSASTQAWCDMPVNLTNPSASFQVGRGARLAPFGCCLHLASEGAAPTADHDLNPRHPPLPHWLPRITCSDANLHHCLGPPCSCRPTSPPRGPARPTPSRTATSAPASSRSGARTASRPLATVSRAGGHVNSGLAAGLGKQGSSPPVAACPPQCTRAELQGHSLRLQN